MRVSSRLAIAVDPRNAQRVYLAWCDGAVTPVSPFRLHLRRSDDAGATWTGDLLTVDDVTNPGLAVNVRGTVGLLYQRLTTPAAGPRWETHLAISDDQFATVRDNMIVADVPDLGGTFQPTIGDYANLIAVGKDFHGAFCGYNEPVAANFPGGATYQRNADWANQRLLRNDGVTVAANSIDPFYFHFTDTEPYQDFYVRDWTDSPTSGDSGVEPSSHPAFWATPDVWNRRGTSPGAFPNDQPDNEPAGNGAGAVGENWAFARIRRRAPAAPGGTTTVTLQQLAAGDQADILQTARWQAELLERAFQHDRAGATLARAARTFVDAYGAGRVGDDEYTSLLRDGFENSGNLTDVGDPADFQRLRAGLKEVALPHLDLGR